MSIAIYECNVLKSMNKTGKMKVDANGYREICLGAFNCMSEKGEFYLFTKAVEAMFKPGSRLRQQIDTGRLRGEIEHPYPTAGMTLPAFMNRVRMIHNQFVGHHIKSVRLEDGKDHQGKRIVKVFGMVIGSGPYGQQLNAKFDNPDENVDFSIRSLTRPAQLVDGIPQKEVTLVVTWDQVNQGGIAVANKLDTPSLESQDSPIWMPDDNSGIQFTENTLIKAEELLLDQKSMGMESNEVITSTMVRSELGWEKVQLISPRSSANW